MDFRIDGLAQVEGVEVTALIREPLLDRPRDVGRLQHALIGRSWDIMLLDDLRAPALLGEQLHRGQKEVMQQPPLGGVQVVQPPHDRRLVEA